MEERRRAGGAKGEGELRGQRAGQRNGGADEEIEWERVLEGGDAIVGLGLTVGLGSNPLLCLFYSFYFLFLFISSLWHMGKASPCSPRRRLAL